MVPHSIADPAPSPPSRKSSSPPASARGGESEDKRELRRRATHLVVMQHGLHGSERDLEHFERLFALHFGEEGVYVHCGQRNAETFFQTYDGVDQGGERLADEVQALATEMPRLRKFSMVGHSLGGLYNRYCIGLLFARGFFRDVEPVNFVTLATPHLGIRRPHRGSFNFLWNVLSPKVLSRTGQQLHLVDTPTELSLSLSKRADLYPDKKVYPAWADMKGELLVSRDGQAEQKFRQLYCVLEAGKLRAYACDANAETSSLDTTKREFEVDLAHARVTLRLPEQEHPSSRRRRSRGNIVSNILSFGRANDSGRGSDASEPRNFDVHIECSDAKASAYTLRIQEDALLRDWKWLVALSNSSLGIDVVTSSTMPRDDAEKPLPLLSCMVRGQFMQALLMFKVRSLYANVFFDFQVPYSGAAIRAYNPYRVDLQRIVTSPAYRHITLASVHNATPVRDTTSKQLKQLTADYALSLNDSSPSSSPPSSARSVGDEGEDHHSIGTQGKWASVPASLGTPSTSSGSIWPSRRRSTWAGTKPHLSSASTAGLETPRPEPFIAGDVVVDQLWHAYTSDPEQDALRGMLLSIQSVGWRRMETVFSNMLAHEKIIAKRANPAKPLDSGLDVVHHAIDTFLL